MKTLLTRSFGWVLVAVVLLAGPAPAGTFIPASIVDQTPTVPLQNPNPSNCEPRYISGFGSNDNFTVVFEDRLFSGGFDRYRMFSAASASGPTGFPSAAVSCAITGAHFLIKDWPITIDGTNYNYRGWSACTTTTSFSRVHTFFVAKELTNWVRINTFPITNAVGFNTSGDYVYYGFHDIIPINGKYYAWGESAGGGTYVCRSPDGAMNWEAFACVGGDSNSPGPLRFPGTDGPTPSGNFIDLGYNRGYGKIQVSPDDDAFYLAINLKARANLAPAAFEAAFTNVNNWTWNNGTTGLCTNATAILQKTAEHDLRECWVVPNTDPDADWVIIYDGDFYAADGSKALGYATLTPPEPGPVHNVTKDWYYDVIQDAIDEADPGDVIQVDPGVYKSFTINKMLTIQGAGNSADPGVSTIVTGASPAVNITASGTSETARIVLADMRMTRAKGTLNTGAGVHLFSAVSHVTVSNVVCANNEGYGLCADGGGPFSDILVLDSVFTSNGASGIKFPSGCVLLDVIIDGCSASNNVQSALLSYSTSSNLLVRNSTFAGNAVAANTYADITLTEFNSDVHFENVVVIGNGAQEGIRVSGDKSGTIPTGAVGRVSFTNVTIRGTFTHSALMLTRYTNATAMSFTNVQLPSDSPVGLHLGTLHGEIDLGSITFSGTNADGYIVMGAHGAGYSPPSGGYATSTVAADATSCSFPNAADNFEIEDGIYHVMDQAGIGRVAWVPGQVFVTQNSGSLGQGVELVAPGGTLNVGPGTFTQDVAVVISNAMTVKSDTGDCGTSDTILTGPGGIFVIQDNVDGVIIQGFRFENVTGDDCISGAAPANGQNNVMIISNCFVNNEYAAVDGSSNAGPNTRTNWLVAHNLIDGVTLYPYSGLRFMILQDSRIVSNTIRNIAYNGMTLEALVNVEIIGNTISNTYGPGIQVANSSAGGPPTPFYSTNVTIAGNTIVAANTNNTADKGGISVYPDVESLVASNNTLTGNNNGFTVRNQPGAVSAGIHVNENNIYGNSGDGAANNAQGGGTLDAEDNWWGSYAGAGATDGGGRVGDTVSAGVDADPWTYGEYGANHDSDGLLDPDDADDEDDGLSDIAEVHTFHSDPLDPDTDGDQIPDGWEGDNGLDPTNSADAALNADTDPFSNLEEYFADTCPTNKDSFLHLTDIERTNSATVWFACTNSRVYSLEYSEMLDAGYWMLVSSQTNVQGEADGDMSLTDTNDAAFKAYRVTVELP